MKQALPVALMIVACGSAFIFGGIFHVIPDSAAGTLFITGYLGGPFLALFMELK